MVSHNVYSGKSAHSRQEIRLITSGEGRAVHWLLESSWFQGYRATRSGRPSDPATSLSAAPMKRSEEASADCGKSGGTEPIFVCA